MAGPPVEVQVRVNTGGSVAGSVSNWKVISPGIVTWPVGGERVGEQLLFDSLSPFNLKPNSWKLEFEIDGHTEGN